MKSEEDQQAYAGYR